MILPLGYRYAAAYAGLRKVEKNDLALIVSDEPASAAAVFTTNRVQAAPVKLAKAHLKASRGKVSAVLINAGNANCATRTGERVALTCCKAVAKAGRIPVEQVFPASTGVIGVEMDAGKVLAALPALYQGLDVRRFPDAAHAILTTDLTPKTASAEIALKGGVVSIAGMTKGSGMIQPGMATTLGFVMMDCAIAPQHLKPILKAAVDRSYNCLSVDGDMSTNDTVLLLANGASGVKPNAKERQVVAEVLTWVLEDLAEQIARDGEGAKKLVRILVRGTKTREDAVRIGRAIANSPLVKTAVAGSDANWGRILSAAGYSGVVFDPAAVDISLQGVRVCRKGLAAPFDETALKKKLDENEVMIRFDIQGRHTGCAQFWTCDFTEGYIRINASYRT